MNLQPVRERSDVALARRSVRRHAESARLHPDIIDRIEIVVSEGAANFIRHANGGEMLCGPNRQHNPTSFDIAFIDRGPGIARVERALEDGYSTIGGLGQGLGAMRRLADDFDLFSKQDVGTTIATRFFVSRDRSASPHRDVSHDRVGFVVPMPGQDVSGDGVCFATTETGQDRILVCDGLGHGPAAHDASKKAIEIFGQCGDRSVADTVGAIDSGIAGTRGVVALVVEMEAARYPAIAAVGVGNIAGQIVAPQRTRHIVSFDGTLGRGARKIERLVYDDLEWRAVILATDGIRMRWNLDDYPGLLSRSPLTIAATLWRDFNRGTDDSGIAVVRWRGE